jgi:hypothetical protein
VDTGVDTLLPLSIDLASVATHIRVVSLGVLHRLVARIALVSNTVCTVGAAIRDTSSTVVHETVGGKHESDLPVGISAVEQKLFEIAMLGDVLVLDQDGTLILHVAGRRSRVLIIVAIVLNGKTFRRNDPVAADGHFLRVVRRPNLDLGNVTIGKTGSGHFLVKRSSVLVITFVALKKASFTSDKNLKVGHKVFGEITTTQVSLDLGKDLAERFGLNVLGSINAVSRKTDGDQVSHVGSNALTHVITLSVNIGEARKPSVVELEGISPRVQASFAMEIHYTNSSWGVLCGGDSLRVGVHLIDPVVSKVRARSWRGSWLSSPGSAPVGATITVILDIVTSTWHMVNNSVGVDTDTVGAAGGDKAAESFARSTATLEVVSNGLIVEVPGVELTLLGPFIGHDWLHGGEDLDAHPAHLSESLTLGLDVLMRPAEHLDDTSLLTVLVGSILLNYRVLPNEVGGLKGNREFTTLWVSGLHGEGESLSKGRSCGVGAGGNISFIVPVVGNIDNWVMLTTASLNLSTLTVRGINDIVIALNTAVALVFRLPVVASGKGGLESAVGPGFGLVSLIAWGALEVIEVRAVVSKSEGSKKGGKNSRFCSKHT